MDIDWTNDDAVKILGTIFRCLPVASLVRFKMVSKRWHAIISNPREWSPDPDPNPAQGLFCSCTKVFDTPFSIQYVPFHPTLSVDPPLSQLHFLRPDSPIEVWHSCNGLLLCRNRDDFHNETCFVYNPTINHVSSVALPNLSLRSNHVPLIESLSLAFDPAASRHYKVVCIQQTMYQRHLGVYSSETGVWRAHDRPFPCSVNFRNPVYWNRNIHWINENEHQDSWYYNIDSDLLRRMPRLPQVRGGWNINYYFGESCGHLHFIPIGRNYRFNVYEMRRDYSWWFVKYTVSHLVEALHKYLSFNRIGFYVVCLVRGKEGDDNDDAFIVVRFLDGAIRYKMVPGEHEDLPGFQGVCQVEGERYGGVTRVGGGNAHQYIRSLCYL